MQINTGLVVIPVERDGEHVGNISFKPGDIGFAQKYYEMLGDFDAKGKEFKEKARELDPENSNPLAGIRVMKEICDYYKSQIDRLFGVGTSEMVFGDACTLDMFSQFFNGIAPYIQSARSAKVDQYINTKKRSGGKK